MNITRVMTSWMIFNCIRLKGPPLPSNPKRLAGTWAQYSKKAIPHEKRMTPISGQWVLILASCSFRWPYQAKVINMLDKISRPIVASPLIMKIQNSKTVQNYIFCHSLFLFSFISL